MLAGQSAPGDHASAACTAGACSLVCDAGYGDCDGDPQNGCETPLDTTDHCGACGTACSAYTDGGAACIAGSCARRYDSGFGDCDGDRRTAARRTISTSATSCGTCGTSCAGAPTRRPRV
ncbi:MAG: hypothetical protein R3F14_23070 [Polyangiaceae bacterium]